MPNVGMIIVAAFALPARHPLAVAIWSLVYAMLALGVEATGSGAALLFQLAGWVVTAWLTPAAYRLALRPDRSGPTGLGFGADELRMIGLFLLLGFAVVLLALVFGFSMEFLMGGGASVAGEDDVKLVEILAALTWFAGIVWLLVRFSLIYGLTFLTGRITIRGSWDLTRGHFWVLLAAFAVVGLILSGLWSSGTVAMDRAAAGGGMGSLVAGIALHGLAGGLAVAMLAGAAAQVLSAIGPVRDDLVRTFE